MSTSDAPPDPTAHDAASIATWLQAHIADLLEVPASSIDPAASFDSYGMASSDAVFLSGDLSEYLDRPLSATLAWDHPSIAELSDLLARLVRGEAELPSEAPDWDLGSDLFG